MRFIHCLLLSFALAAQAAQAADALESTLEAHKVVRAANGEERFASADLVRPGDELEYRSIYRNVSAKPLNEIVATLPIPEGYEYMEGTASAKALASSDGKLFAPLPLMRLVEIDGRKELRPVPYSEYRFLRWHIGVLSPDASAVVVARVRVPDNSQRSSADR